MTDNSSDLWACSPFCSMFRFLAIKLTFDKSLFLLQIRLPHWFTWPTFWIVLTRIENWELCWPALRTQTSRRCWRSDSATSATISPSTASLRSIFLKRVPQSRCIFLIFQVSRSLYQKDKRIFTFILCLDLMIYKQQLETKDVDILMAEVLLHQINNNKTLLTCSCESGPNWLAM